MHTHTHLQVVERAELKLQMDFAVIQAGRLAEKHKNLSKEEALAAVRYGADKVFRSETGERARRSKHSQHTTPLPIIWRQPNALSPSG